MLIEALEDRCLFAAAAAVAASMDAYGSLTVQGTSAADNIKVTERYSSASVYSGTTLIGTFNSVKKVTINAVAGNDTVSYTGYDFGATLNLGTGSCTVSVYDYSPSTAVHTVVSGGAANKTTVYTSYGATITAGKGANTITVSGGTALTIRTNGNGYTDTISLASSVTGCSIYADKADKLTNLGTNNKITLS